MQNSEPGVRPDEHAATKGSTDVEAASLIARARTGVYPPNWYVWPMQTKKVRRGLIRWAIYAVGGFVFFIPALFIMIPDNFSGSEGKAIASLLILLALGAMAFGSLFYFVHDLLRLRRASEYLLLMTPDDFALAEPRRITHVPMDAISNITLKGVRNPGSPFYTPQAASHSAMSMLVMPQRRAASPSPFHAPVLTFRDTRTNRIITISQDDAYDDLRAIEEVLGTFVDEKVKARKAAQGTQSESEPTR